MAKAIGAKVITTAGSDAKVKKCLELGADAAINYKTQDVPAEIKRAAPNGLNVHWETLRESDFDKAIGLMAPRGRMIMMAGRDARPVFPVGPFYLKGSVAVWLHYLRRSAGRAACTAWSKIFPGWRRAKSNPASTVCCRWRRLQRRTSCKKKARSANSGTLTGKIVLTA